MRISTPGIGVPTEPSLRGVEGRVCVTVGDASVRP